MTATKDLEILVSNKKEVNTDSMSVKRKLVSKNFFTIFGKCKKEKTKLSQVKRPNNNPSYILFLY